MSNPESIESRLSRLERWMQQDEAARVLECANNIIKRAEADTFASILKELAVRAGLSEAQLEHHIRLRFEWYRDRHHQKVEEINPSYAAQTDARSIDEIPTGSAPPPLFPP